MLAATRAASWMAFEPLLESGDLRAERSARSGTKKSDHRHRRLLRARHEWPHRRRAAEQRDELPSFLIELHPIPTSWDRTRQNIELARISQKVTERFYNLLAVGEGG
jgi:hypothetical protein